MKKLLLIGIALGSIVLVGCGKTPTQNLDEFAKCVTTAGAKMYGLATCSHCQSQKALFGDSFQYITYVDCKETPTACSALKGVPTREFKDGSQLEGEQTLGALGAKTDCALPKL